MRRLACLLFACGCALGLAGCTPVSAGFITTKDGGYVLTIPERCGLKIVNVSVAYYTDGSEPNPDLWAATAELDLASNQVILFQPNDGYKTEGDPTKVDFTRELDIGWGEGENDSPAGAAGVLADLGPDQVLWANGITSSGDYDRETTGGMPGGYRCVEKEG
jgi:hypothetical protein